MDQGNYDSSINQHFFSVNSFVEVEKKNADNLNAEFC